MLLLHCTINMLVKPCLEVVYHAPHLSNVGLIRHGRGNFMWHSVLRVRLVELAAIVAVGVAVLPYRDCGVIVGALALPDAITTSCHSLLRSQYCLLVAPYLITLPNDASARIEVCEFVFRLQLQ